MSSIERLDIIIQSVIPAVFDDSLSHNETLAKVVAKVNEQTEVINDLVENGTFDVLVTDMIQTDPVVPTDLHIATGPGKTLVLDNPVYSDLYTGVASAKVPAANFPTWSAFTANTNAYTFAIGDYVDLSTIEILHDYKEGTDLELHLHLATNGLNNATVRKVKYICYYTWSNPDQGTHQFIAEDSLTAELTIPANNPDKSSFYLSLGTIAGANLKIGAQLKLRIKRIAGTGSEPAANPFLGMVGVHYQIDTLGSRTASAK